MNKDCKDGRKKYNGAKKGRSVGEVKQLLEQAKLDGNRMQIKIWTDTIRKLENDKKNNTN